MVREKKRTRVGATLARRARVHHVHPDMLLVGGREVERSQKRACKSQACGL